MSVFDGAFTNAINEELDSSLIPNGNIDLISFEAQLIEKLKQDNKRIESNTEERVNSAKWVRSVIPSWLGITAGILIGNGLNILNLSDTTLGILLGTTTVNVLGLGYILLKGLFPENKEDIK